MATYGDVMDFVHNARDELTVTNDPLAFECFDLTVIARLNTVHWGLKRMRQYATIDGPEDQAEHPDIADAPADHDLLEQLDQVQECLKELQRGTPPDLRSKIVRLRREGRELHELCEAAMRLTAD